MMFDCANDTILVHANPVGPTCHKGTPSCFLDSDPQLSFLHNLEATIELRKQEKSESSYTAKLFSQGLARMCQKVGEEGVEVSLAAIQGHKDELLQESADLIFHLMVLLNSQDRSLSDVINVLKNRHKPTANK
jgi:phosphoribosyl-ATP pyrophosphohydrolase/phosphoribosyl-AMP cyclohydrolase